MKSSYLINAVSFGNVMFLLYALIVFILVLGVIILVHEGGHFFFAKKAGILCHEYSIGMGPVVKSKKKGETSYSVRAVPIGGFVSMAGEDTNEAVLKEGQKVSLSFKEVKYCDLFFSKDGKVEEKDELTKVVSEISLTDKVVKEVSGTVLRYDLYSKDGNAMYIVLDVDGKEQEYLVARDAFYIFSEKQVIQMAPYERCFEAKTKWQRFLTVFAGPMMNFVLAFVIFLVVGMCQGVANNDSPVIGEVNENYYAGKVLQEGDRIVSIKGINDAEATKVESWDEVSDVLDSHFGAEELIVVFERDGNLHEEVIKTVNISYRLGVSNIGYEEYAGPGLQVFLIFDKNYVAGKAGVASGDILLGYYDKDNNYHELNAWNELFAYLDTDANMEELKIKYSHNGEVKEVTSKVWTERSIDDVATGEAAATLVGISPTTRFSLIGGFVNACVLFWNSITAVFVTLGALFGNSQITINDLSGPVGIFAAIKQQLGTDVLSFFSFVALISANIGLVNLLPLPALDGGRIVFIGYELVTGKEVNKKVETVLINIVFWLVMGLFVYITFKDIFRLF